jgi:hypothetical protein
VIVSKRRHEKLDLHCLPKFEFCAGNLNPTTFRMDGNFGCMLELHHTS